MSKMFLVIFLLLVVFLTPKVNAQTLKNCTSVRTVPTELITDSKKITTADFIVDVGNVNDYANWKIQFECGFSHQKKDANKVTENDKEISTKIDNTATGCEFSAGIHTLKAIAVVPGKGEIPQCVGVYNIIDSDTQCQLDIAPQTGITSATDIIISGNNLTNDGRFGVFMDGGKLSNLIKDPPYVKTPNFGPSSSSGVKIPNDLLIPGAHTISLRRYQLSSRYVGDSLCSLNFTVGTPSDPGGLIKTFTGSSSKNAVISAIPALSGGKQVIGCGDTTDIRGAAIVTAIGCIHTNPAELVKDIMTWVIGIGGGLAFLMMLFGAFQMLTSAGNPETLNAGRERLTSAVIGLLFVVFAILFLQIIGADILQIPGFGR